MSQIIPIIIGRHGAKNVTSDPVLKEQISPESLTRLHSQGKDIVQGYLNPQRMPLFVSQRPRTTATGKARFAGMLGLKVPKDQTEVLDDNKFSRLALVPVNQRFGLGFYNGEINDDFYLAAEKEKLGLGGKVCTEFGLRSLYAEEHEGKKVLPFAYIVAKSGKALSEAIDLAHPRKSDLVQVISHSVITDAGVAALVSSGKGNDKILTNCDDYGGPFGEEDFGLLQLEHHETNGLQNKAKFIRNGQAYPVNLDNFGILVGRLDIRFPASLYSANKKA